MQLHLLDTFCTRFGVFGVPRWWSYYMAKWAHPLGRFNRPEGETLFRFPVTQPRGRMRGRRKELEDSLHLNTKDCQRPLVLDMSMQPAWRNSAMNNSVCWISGTLEAQWKRAETQQSFSVNTPLVTKITLTSCLNKHLKRWKENWRCYYTRSQAYFFTSVPSWIIPLV